MKVTRTDDPFFNLSGMTYYSGYYTPEEWKEKTGVDPKRYPEYIKISRHGKCIWTSAAQRITRIRSAQITGNFNAIGVST